MRLAERAYYGLMQIYLVRHGETEIGPDLLYPEDAALTPLGHRQAAVTAETLRSVAFTHIFTSGLRRAKETAIPLVDITGRFPVALEDLDEIRIGDLRTASPEVKTRRIYHSGIYSDFSEFNGESSTEFERRVSGALIHQVVAGIPEHDAIVALIIHGGTMGVILDYADGQRFDPRLGRNVPNGGIAVLNVDRSRRMTIARPPGAEHLAEVGVTHVPRPAIVDQPPAGSGGGS